MLENQISYRLNNFGSKVSVAITSNLIADFSHRYSLHGIELLSSYGKDFIGPLLYWGSLQLVSIIHPRFYEWSKSPKALIPYSIFALGIETHQYFNRDIAATIANGPRYDPWDFVAFGAGTAFAMAVNKYILQRK